MLDLNRKLLRLISVRVLVILSVIVPYVLLNPDRFGDPVLKLTVGFSSLQLLVYLALFKLLESRPKIQAYIQLIGDLVFVTLLIHRLESGEPFSAFYMLVITIAALLLPRNGVLSIAGIAYVLYASTALGWLGSILPPRSPVPPLPTAFVDAFRLTYNLIMHLVGFYAIAIMTSYLVREEQRAQARLKKTHLDLSYLQGLYGDVIQSMSSGLAITDLEGILVGLNESGASILGHSQEALQGQHICETGIFSPEEWARQVKRSEETSLRSELKCARQDGREIDLGFTLTQLRDNQGNRHGHILIFQDLTEWHRLQDQVRMQDRMAAIGQMAAGLAHEVGNPLAAISGSVEMLSRSSAVDPAQRTLLEITLKESRRLDRTVKAFLQFAKPSEGRPSAFDIAAVLRESIQLLRNSEDVLASHEIESRLEPDTAWIQADLDQIRQIFWNLARNALQSMPEGGRLTVVGELHEERYHLHFSDTGHGMTEEEKARLFQPFKSFFDSGLGLGMAIVYRIVEEHGGEIRVDSRVDQGTTITVDLPLQPPVRSEEPFYDL